MGYGEKQDLFRAACCDSLFSEFKEIESMQLRGTFKSIHKFYEKVLWINRAVWFTMGLLIISQYIPDMSVITHLVLTAVTVVISVAAGITKRTLGQLHKERRVYFDNLQAALDPIIKDGIKLKSKLGLSFSQFLFFKVLYPGRKIPHALFVRMDKIERIVDHFELAKRSRRENENP